jgi:hypothetical protein
MCIIYVIKKVIYIHLGRGKKATGRGQSRGKRWVLGNTKKFDMTGTLDTWV